MNAISMENVTFSYIRGRKEETILDDISFHIKKNENACLLGCNGAGKSTILKCILGTNKQYSGTIKIDGMDIKKLSISQIASKVAYVPQAHFPSFAYKVIDIVIMGSAIQYGYCSSPKKETYEEARSLLEKFGIGVLADKKYTAISGGERQLVLIARALLQHTHILLLDEPTSNLDYGNQVRVLEVLQKLANSGYTILQTTHNPELAYLFADYMLTMKDGKILRGGEPQEVICTEQMKQIYQINVSVASIMNDKMRVCVPELLDVREFGEKIIV